MKQQISPKNRRRLGGHAPPPRLRPGSALRQVERQKEGSGDEHSRKSPSFFGWFEWCWSQIHAPLNVPSDVGGLQCLGTFGLPPQFVPQPPGIQRWSASDGGRLQADPHPITVCSALTASDLPNLQEEAYCNHWYRRRALSRRSRRSQLHLWMCAVTVE